MPTVGFSTSVRRSLGGGPRVPRAVADVRHLLWFRLATMRRRRGFLRIMAGMLVVTTAVVVVPTFLGGAQRGDQALNILTLLPTAFAGFLLLALTSAVVSGGGRELLPRDQGAPHPISPTTDHLGALLLAPVNIAWLLQAWTLMASASYALPPADVPAAQVIVVLWLVAATAMAQAAAWAMEAIRRQSHGIFIVRVMAVVLVGMFGWLQLTGRLTDFLDQIPTVWFVIGAVGGFSWRWLLTALVEVLLIVAAVLAGVIPAHLAARRTPRDELRVETEQREPRPHPRSDFAALVRTDRSSVWRTVPMRRGLAVLAIGPGLVAFAGGLPWYSMTILPGLVASGGALLFGVNAWCLDGRGGLWRESLPVEPGTVFAARAYVMGEFLLVASVVTLLLGSLRAGVPTSAELTALLCTLGVVTWQVVAAALRWSDQRPYPVDLRSARATPAPPTVMVGYSTRLAISTTLTGLVFSGLARVPAWELSVLVAIPFLAWSSVRLLRTRRRWLDPVTRARVVTTVAA